MEDFAAKVIAAHQAGVQERQRQTQLEQEQAQRDLSMKIAKHQLDRLKIEDEIANQGAAENVFKSMEGAQAPTYTVPGGIAAPTSTGAQAFDQSNLAKYTPPAEDQQIAGQLPEVNFPGLPSLGISGYTRRPTSMQEVLALQRQAQIQAIRDAATKAGAEEAAKAPYIGHTTPQGGTTTYGIPGLTPSQTVTGEPKAPEVRTHENMTIDGKGPVPLTETIIGGKSVWTDTSGKLVDPTKIGNFKTPKDTGAQDAALLNRSYDAEIKRLDESAKPVTDALEGFSRVREALTNPTPESVALLVPEALKVMVGGQGSGIRINQSEQENLVGGRSKWEALKASLQAWSPDPKKATKLTTEQLSQIATLVSAAEKRTLAKRDVITAARTAMVTAASPQEHKKIVNDAKNALDAISSGGGGSQSNSPPQTLIGPNGKVLTLGADGKYH